MRQIFCDMFLNICYVLLEGHDAIRQEFNVKIDGLTLKIDVNSFLNIGIE